MRLKALVLGFDEAQEHGRDALVHEAGFHTGCSPPLVVLLLSIQLDRIPL